MVFTSLDQSCRIKIPEKGSLDVDSKLFSKVQVYSKRGLGSAIPESWDRATTRTHNFTFGVGAISAESPL
jgi:hypothetical protein